MPSGLKLAIGLRDEHSSDRVRSVSLLPERKRQFTQPPLHPVRFDVRKVLTIHARCALVRAALGIGMRQDIVATDLVVQGVEADSPALPSLSRATPSAASEHLPELLGCPISTSLATCCVRLELRSLPSIGITRLQRYCEPLSHPRAPGLSVTGVRLIVPDHALGFPVLRALSLCACCRHYPGAATGAYCFAHARPVVSAFPDMVDRVGLRIDLFEACSAFTRVTACTLALPPIRGTLTRRLQTFRYLHDWQSSGGNPGDLVCPAALAEPDLESYSIRLPAWVIHGRVG